MEKLYSKEQLVEAMTLYNQEVIDNPEGFDYSEKTAKDKAVSQIDYLLSLVPAE